MKIMTADSTFLNAIQQLSEPTEIVDAEGHLIAAIYPHVNSRRPFVDIDRLRQLRDECPRSADLSTRQLLEHLQSLGKTS